MEQNEKLALIKEWTDKYNEAEEKIREIEKNAAGVREQFKVIYRQEILDQQRIQYEYWKKIDDLLRKDNNE